MLRKLRTGPFSEKWRKYTVHLKKIAFVVNQFRLGSKHTKKSGGRAFQETFHCVPRKSWNAMFQDYRYYIVMSSSRLMESHDDVVMLQEFPYEGCHRATTSHTLAPVAQHPRGGRVFTIRVLRLRESPDLPTFHPSSREDSLSPPKYQQIL